MGANEARLIATPRCSTKLVTRKESVSAFLTSMFQNVWLLVDLVGAGAGAPLDAWQIFTFNLTDHDK